jgi:hypothetical protein
VKHWLQRLVGRRSAQAPAIVVVSGLPRSGTSMLMGMLAAGGVEIMTDGLRTPNADNPKGYYEFEPIKDLATTQDRAWIGNACGKAIKVVSPLLQYLPDTFFYKIVFVRRDLKEVLASQQAMLARRGEPAGDSSDEDMARIFAAHLAQVEAALGRRARCEVLYVNYRDALRDPRKVAGDIGRFLGRPLDLDRMAGVVDDQLYRNRG